MDAQPAVSGNWAAACKPFLAGIMWAARITGRSPQPDNNISRKSRNVIRVAINFIKWGLGNNKFMSGVKIATPSQRHYNNTCISLS
jgi:hypothetical protein